jgi:hypothetical protein
VRQALFDPRQGMSSTDDMYSGGASYFFTRISDPQGKESYGNAPHSKRGQFHFYPDLLLQTDMISYDSDTWGQSDPSTKAGRNTTIAGWKKAAKNGGNEAIIKNGIPLLQYLKRLRASSATERNSFLSEFRQRGISEIRGVPIEQIVVVDP